jgi:hypothetical protein
LTPTEAIHEAIDYLRHADGGSVVVARPRGGDLGIAQPGRAGASAAETAPPQAA